MFEYKLYVKYTATLFSALLFAYIVKVQKNGRPDSFLELMCRILRITIKTIKEVLVDFWFYHTINCVIWGCDHVKVVYLIIDLVHCVNVVQSNPKNQANPQTKAGHYKTHVTFK